MELDYTFMADTFVKIWGGIGTTLGLTVLSLAIAFPIAFYMAILRVRGHVIGSAVTGAYISFVRGDAYHFTNTAVVQPASELS